jgi:predicted RNA-binding Zn-ribbon protein involved in translation (DUF1610 family)
MPISFQCPGCGKKLKAPDKAAGKTSTCPGCGGPVTCPEPVYDADVVEMTPIESSGVDPYAELGADQPYGVVEPQPAADSSTERRRPCPMCGEMILATAAKCRFCGEVFDPALKKGKGRGGKKKELRTIAVYQRYLMISLLILITGNIVSYVSQRAVANAPPAPAMLVLILLIALVAVTAWVAGIVFAVMLANKVYNVAAAIFVGILSIIPCVNFITWLVVSGKATRMLKDKGIEVGFLGADLSDF